MTDFKVGEYIVYNNGDRYEIGRIKELREDGAFVAYHDGETGAMTPYDLAPTIRGWIPCSERLPKVGRVVLLSTTDGAVVIGHREKPDLIWQVTEEDGRKHWVYDPESYEVDIDELPKSEDCGFIEEGDYSDGMLSVTSVNYDDRFGGVIAWMPLPPAYKEETDE